MLGRERSWARKWLGTGGKWHLRKRKGGKAEIGKRACCRLNNENCFHVVIVLGEQGSEMMEELVRAKMQGHCVVC